MVKVRVTTRLHADRATVVVHAPLSAMRGSDDAGRELDGGPVIHPETMRRPGDPPRDDAAGRV
jgi:hypothetical protein